MAIERSVGSALLAATLFACNLTAAAAAAPGEPTLQQLVREARAGGRVTGIDAAGNLSGEGGGFLEPPRDDLSEAARAEIMSTIAANRARLVSEGKLSPFHDKTITNFTWPLRKGAGRTDFDNHGISNYVDENAAFPNQLRDYNCGARTYDLPSGYNHQGTDIFVYPFSWKKMDDEDVVIVAGAAGTILAKSDGNFDRSCAMSGNNWNAVYVQHADGSVAWYGHMKNGSTTVKGVGHTVAAGEYLGVVGSSGSSTGPHLHLELYDAANALVDPWLGACNTKSKQVTWAQQRPYRDSAVNALTVGMSAPVFPTCPTQGAANAALLLSSGFAPANVNESAILVTLNPGAYTAIVTGVSGGTGVGIVEVFAVP